MENEPTIKKPKTGKTNETKSIKPPLKRRRGSKLFSFILFLGIIGAIALFAWAEMQRRDAVGRLEQTEQELAEIRESTKESARDVAQRVLEQVRVHMEVPDSPEPTVATIVDVERLRQTSEFYNKAKNGDHLIITSNRAILYNPDINKIIDVVPVKIDNQANQETAPEEKTEETTVPEGGEQPPASGETTEPAATETPVNQ